MVSRTRIKICGMTRKEDVEQAVQLGVDALGVIFVPESPRYISPEDAREILKGVPPFIHVVGVFKNEDPAIVHEILQYCGLSVVQLHGSEPPKYAEAIAGTVVKAFGIQSSTDAAQLAAYQDVVDGFLLDTYRAGTSGGTGSAFDWKLVERLQPPGPVILAGGLSPDNVADAISQVHPFAVDVNSGVEIEPGVKDMAKVQALVEAVRTVDAERSN